MSWRSDYVNPLLYHICHEGKKIVSTLEAIFFATKRAELCFLLAGPWRVASADPRPAASSEAELFLRSDYAGVRSTPSTSYEETVLRPRHSDRLSSYFHVGSQSAIAFLTSSRFVEIGSPAQFSRSHGSAPTYEQDRSVCPPSIES